MLHPYHQKYETTKLLDGYPKYVFDEEENTESILIDFSPQNFKELFFQNKKGNIHFYGNITAKGGRYNHFINGNLFYEWNKPAILPKFFEKIKSIKGNCNKIVFITADEGTNNSAFLEDLSLMIQEAYDGIEITILRFNAHHEYIDSFINNNKKILTVERDKRLLIYFEEVMSAAGTFKLLSDNIIHYCTVDDTIEENKYLKHGFDYIFTLVDRVAHHVEYEVLKKMYSKKNPDPIKHYIKFFELNAPVFTSPHMGNAIKNEEKIVDNIKKASNLDAIKKYIIDNELVPKRIKLPKDLYSPTKKEEEEKYNHLNLTKSQFNLIKLYCTDIIYKELSELSKFSEQEDTHDKPEFSLDAIFQKINTDNDLVGFTTEKRLLNDIALKILTKHPFIHYKNICEKVLEYCIQQLNTTTDKLSNKISEQDDPYDLYWNLRFYIKRLVELNSKYILSDTFFNFLFLFFSKNKVYEDLVELAKKDSLENYKKTQIQTFSAFLIYCYKRLVYDDFGTSIKLEQLLDKHSYHKKITTTDLSFEQTTDVIKDDYFKLLDMLALENIYPFKKIYKVKKARTTTDIPDSVFKSVNEHYYDFFMQENEGDHKGLEYLDWYKDADSIHLHEIIDRIFENIQGTIPGEARFSLIYKYNKEVSGNKEDYYYFSRKNNNPDNVGSLIGLDDNGFISRLINGVEHNCKTQSFYTVLKKDEAFYTFNKHYVYQGTESPITDALKTDLEKTDVINNEDNLYFFIRLSDIDSQEISGKGVIVISLPLENTTDFFKTIDSRKMRNLLYVRKFILKEMKSKFEGESFQQILERINAIKIKSRFNHGTDILFTKATTYLQDPKKSGYHNLYHPFNQIYKQSKIEVLGISELGVQEETLSAKHIQKVFDIYKNIYFDSAKADKIKLSVNFEKEIDTGDIIIDLVIPELLWTGFKVIVPQKIKDEDLKFEITMKNDTLEIINPCYQFEETKLSKKNGGLEMVNTIMKHLSFEPVKPKKINEKQVLTKVQLKK